MKEKLSSKYLICGLVLLSGVIGFASSIEASRVRKSRPESYYHKPPRFHPNQKCLSAMKEEIYELNASIAKPDWQDPNWKKLIKTSPGKALSLLSRVQEFRQVFDYEVFRLLIALKHSHQKKLEKILLQFLSERRDENKALNSFKSEQPLFTTLLLAEDEDRSESALRFYAMDYAAHAAESSQSSPPPQARFYYDSQFFWVTDKRDDNSGLQVIDVERMIRRHQPQLTYRNEMIPSVLREISISQIFSKFIPPARVLENKDPEFEETYMSQYENILNLFLNAGIDYGDAMIMTEVALTGLNNSNSSAVFVTQDYRTIWSRLAPDSTGLRSFPSGLSVLGDSRSNFLKVSIPGEPSMEFYILLGFRSDIDKGLQELARQLNSR